MDVISFRISKELEKSIKEIGINLGEEIRKFIETKVKEQKREWLWKRYMRCFQTYQKRKGVLQKGT